MLLAEDMAATNALVLAELVPALRIRKREDVIRWLAFLPTYDLKIDWDDVMDVQIEFVRKSRHYASIPDLLIFQNASQHDLMMYSFDRDLVELCDLFDRPRLM